MSSGLDQQKRMVEAGIWPLYRYDPRLVEQGKPPLTLDSKPPKLPVSEFMSKEARFNMVRKLDPQRFDMLAEQAQEAATQRISLYQQLSQIVVPIGEEQGGNGEGQT